jgi:N-acyl-D-amino-acid deacylase
VEFDVLIRNGTVIDGSGQEAARPLDVGITGDRISAIGALEDASAATTIDASGRVVCPGFVDVHLHSEVALVTPGHPDRYGALLQGVTTQLLAPDGFGWAPLSPDQASALAEYTRFSHGEAGMPVGWPSAEAYLARFAGRTPANVVPQVPHLAVRFGVMGWAARPATEDELERMRGVVREWLEAGATALNLGLDYQPSAFADSRELVELSRVAREAGAIYAAHIRYTDLGQEAAWRETMEIGRRAEIPVHVSHEHVNDVTEPLLDEAARGCDLTFESYLYPAGCTHLAMMLPTWAQAGGPDGIKVRLGDPEPRRVMRDHLQAQLTGAYGRGRAVFVATQTGRYVGESLADLAAAEGRPIGDVALRIVEEEHPYALMVFHHGTTTEAQRDAVWRTIRHARMMVASDGVYHGQSTHPRGYGCFARVLRLCVRELGAVSLEEAIHKMSGFPAARFRVPDRGLLRAGYAADVVIFDAATVADRATWEEPRLEPVGIDRVIVNGQTVVERGQPTGLLPGRVVRRA